MTASKAVHSKTAVTAVGETSVLASENELQRNIGAPHPVEASTHSSSARRVAIFVLGMHRSGTSALTRVINFLGADLPRNLMPAVAGNNAPGFWESLDAYALNDDILSTAGSSWDDWRRFNPGWLRSSAKQPFHRRAVQLLTQDFSSSSLFVLKDPRICRLVPFWLEALREFDAQPIFVLPVRNPLDVAASLRKRDGFSPAKSQMIWLRNVLDAEYDTRGETRAFVSYDRLLDDWRGAVSTLAQTLDLDWPRRSATVDVEIDRFLDPRLCHHTLGRTSDATHSNAFAWVTETIASLELLQAEPYEETALRRLDAVRAEFDRAGEALGAVLRAEEMAREELATVSSTHIEELQAEAAQRTAYISDLESAAAERTKYTKALESDTAQREALIRELQGTAAQRMAQIQGLESDAAKRDAKVHELEALVAQRDRQIIDLEAAAANQKALISELTELASQREKMIGLLNSKAESTTQLKNQFSTRLNAIQTSAAWSLARPIFAAESRWPRNVRGLAAVPKTVWWTLSLRLPARLHLRRRAIELLAQRLFDDAWYEAQNPEVILNGENPIIHWLCVGWKERRDPNPLFDVDWYLAQNPDVAEAGLNPLVHYFAQGAAEGRDPSALFDTDWYLEQNPDVAQTGLNPLAHYLAQGAAEGRDPNALFDTDWYLEQNPDVAQAGANPLAHYLAHGADEGRDPSTMFDTDWYLAQNPDVAQAKVNPLAHYLAHGAAEGRAPKPTRVSNPRPVSLGPNGATIQAPRSARSLVEAEFDPTFYRSVYCDQANADDPLGHFLSEGWRDGRDPNAQFSTEFYLAAHPDVARAGMNPFVHYLSSGRLEGRTVMGSLERPSPSINEAPSKAPRTGVIAMVKNEADIIEAFVSHLLALFDVIEIVDHGSTDGTREFLADVADRYPGVRIYDLKVRGYIQALTMNFIAEHSAALRDVDWLFLLDADEFLPFSQRASFDTALSKLAPAPIIEMPWINAVPTRYWQYKVTLTPETPFWLPEQPSPYKKVAYQPRLLRDRPIWIDQGNHALLPFRGGDSLKASPAGFHVIHIPVRSADQFLLKLSQGVSAYQQLGNSRDEAQGTHWTQLWETIAGKAPSEEMLNGLVRRYGEETAVEPIVASALPEHGYVQRPLAAAFTQLEQVTIPKSDPSDLMLQMKDRNLAAAAEDGPQDDAPPARLEMRGDNEIHGMAGDLGFEFEKLPAPPVIESTEPSDLRFIADFVRPSYWDIDDLTPSAWTGHLPFMFCLATLVHPRRFVELGTHFGASFLAYCQAAERGAIPTQAIAIDGWEGDEHAGFYDTSVFDQFKFLLKKYDRFGSYLRMYFNDASTRFEEGSIDLLHIDGLHTYEAVREDYSTWLPKMSERGLILFHDINVHERNFGVWRFWKEVKSAHPTMEFRHSHGLGVAYVGTPRGEPIERLISLVSESEEAADLLQQHFEEVAQKSTELFMKRYALRQQEAQFQAVGQASEELTRLRQELAATKVERDEFMRLAGVRR